VIITRTAGIEDFERSRQQPPPTHSPSPEDLCPGQADAQIANGCSRLTAGLFEAVGLFPSGLTRLPVPAEVITDVTCCVVLHPPHPLSVERDLPFTVRLLSLYGEGAVELLCLRERPRPPRTPPQHPTHPKYGDAAGEERRASGNPT